MQCVHTSDVMIVRKLCNTSVIIRMCVVSNTDLCCHNIVVQKTQQKIDELVKRAEKKQGESKITPRCR